MEAIARLAKEISGNPIPWDRGPQPPGAPAGAARAVVGGAPVDAVSQARADLLNARQEAAAATEGARALARAWHREAGAAPASGQPGPVQAPAGTGGGVGIGGVDGTYAARMLRERWEAQQGRQRGQSPAKSGGGGSGMPSGQAVGQWFEEQWPTAAPMIDAAMQGAGPASGMSPQQARLSGGTARARAAMPAPAQAAPVGPSATVLAASHRKALAYARGLSASGAPQAQQEAAWQYAAQLEDALAAAGAPPAGAGGSGGTGGGGGLGGAWSGHIGPALASAAGRYLPVATAGAGIAWGLGALESGYSSYTQAGMALSPLWKTLAGASTSLATFTRRVESAGTTVGMSLSETASAAKTLADALGSRYAAGAGGLANVLANTARYARGMGMSVGSTAEARAVASSLGVTTGIGSVSWNNFALTIANAVASGQMQGRQGEVLASMLTLLQSLAGRSVVVPQASTLAAMASKMNASGYRSLQGYGGANLLAQIGSGMASPGLGNVGQFVQMSTMGKGLSLGEYLVAQTQGPGFVNPVTRLTNLQAVMQGLAGWHPGARFGLMKGEAAGGPPMPLNQAATAEMVGLSSLWHISPTQAEALYQVLMPGGRWSVGGNATMALLQQAGVSLSSLSPAEYQLAADVANANSTAGVRAAMTRYVQWGGAVPSLTGSLGQQKLAAIRALVAHPVSGLSSVESQQAAAQALAQQKARAASHVAPVVAGVQRVLAGAGQATHGIGAVAGPAAVGIGATLLRAGLSATVTAAILKRMGLVGRGAATGAAEAATGGAEATSALASDVAGTAGTSVLADLAQSLGIAGAATTAGLGVLSAIRKGGPKEAQRIGASLGLGAGGWGGALAGAALAAPLDPFTFGLASVAGGLLGAFGGGALGKDVGGALGRLFHQATSGSAAGALGPATLRSLAAWYRMHGGAHYLTPHVMHALSQGPVAAARGALTAAMVQHPATILTPVEQNTQALQNLRLQLERLGSDIAPLVRLAEWAMGNTAGGVANDIQAVGNAPATLAHAAQRAWQAGRAAASGQALSVPGAQRWASSVNLVSRMTGMPAAMIAGVMQLESGGHRDVATGGLMQLTAPALASVTGWSAAKARSMVGHLTPWQSLYYGSEYLRQLSQMPRLSGHLGLILSAYNAGPGAVEAAMRQSHSTSLAGMMAYYRAHPYQRPGWMKQEQSALGGPTYAAQVERYITGAAASGFGAAPTAGTGPVELSQQTINALAQAIGAVMKRAGVPDPRRGLR